MVPRIAVIGAGRFGEMHLRAFAQMREEGRAELVGVADVDEGILARRAAQYQAASFTDYREMLDVVRPSAVSIATPDFLHRRIALDCLAAGTHVFVEKPLETTLEGCREIVAQAERLGLLLQVDFHKRYDPYHAELHDLVARGSLGVVEYGYAHMEDRLEVPRDWFPKWASRSSPAWFLGVHMYDLIRWVIGTNVRRVSATGMKGKLLNLGIDAYDSIQAKLVFDSGASFCVDSSWILPDGHEAIVNQGIRVVGTEGMMEVDTQDRGARGCFEHPTDNRPQTGSGMQTLNLGFFKERRDRHGRISYSGYGIEAIQDFALNVDFLLKGGDLGSLSGRYPDGNDGLQATRVAIAVHRSVEKGGDLIDLACSDFN